MPAYPKSLQLKGAKKKVKKKSRGKLVKELDRVFSIFIRQRDLPGGKGKCYICDKEITVKEAHAMHFITRGCYRYRWDENNVKAGCQICNIWLKGNYIPFTLRMLKEYGEGTIREMQTRKNEVFKLNDQQIIEMTEKYKKLI